MIVVRTVEGNHMRQHRGGGRSNQREVDVIINEVNRCPKLHEGLLAWRQPAEVEEQVANQNLETHGQVRVPVLSEDVVERSRR